MTDPLSTENLLGEFDASYEAWTLQDQRSLQYVTIPDPARYPGRTIFRFFMSAGDAEGVLRAIRSSGNAKVRNATIVAVKVNLHKAMRSLASESSAGEPVGFVVHTPNEVFEQGWR